MARPSKAAAKRKKTEARDERRYVAQFAIVVESADSSRVICLECHLEQAYQTSGDDSVAPCDLCGHDYCITPEAFEEGYLATA